MAVQAVDRPYTSNHAHPGAVVAIQALRLRARVLPAIATACPDKTFSAELVLIALLAGGHVLIEGPPDSGRRTLACAIAQAVGVTATSTECSPTLRPADLLGTTTEVADDHLQFDPGPALTANVLILDQLHRAPDVTQQALEQAITHRRVTIGGLSRLLPQPFMAVATQEPAGNYRTPDVPRDAWMTCIRVGYPSSQHGTHSPSDASNISPVASPAEIMNLYYGIPRSIWLDPVLADYLCHIGEATHNDPRIRQGVSQQALHHFAHACRVRAALRGRDQVIPRDIRELAIPLLAHRIVVDPRPIRPPISAHRLIADITNKIREPIPVSKPGEELS